MNTFFVQCFDAVSFIHYWSVPIGFCNHLSNLTFLSTKNNGQSYFSLISSFSLHTFAWICGLWFKLLYSRKVWRGKSLVNLANRQWFTKLKSFKLVLTINNLLADLLIRQTLFCQILEKSQFTKLFPIKLSCYTVFGMHFSYISANPYLAYSTSPAKN